MKSVGVLGPGGVGGCIGAILSHHDVSVTCIVREESFALLQEKGFMLESRMYGCLAANPTIVTRLVKPVDVLFITTKAYHLEQALNRVDPEFLAQATVIPLLNGLEHMESLRSRIGRNVVTGSIRIEARTVAPGHIIHSSPFLMVTIASDDEATAKHLPDTAAFLTAHGIDTMVGRSEGSVLWDKLIRLAALACTTAATNRPIGYIRSDPHWKTVMEKIVFEAEAVAKAWDVVIDHDVQMKILTDLPESLSSSLQRDIEAGKPSELDAIAGALIRAGKLRGISCPTIEKLMGQILKPGETS